MKRYYLPVKELEKLIWLQNFAGKISGYATKYGIDASTIDDLNDGLDELPTTVSVEPTPRFRYCT